MEKKRELSNMEKKRDITDDDREDTRVALPVTSGTCVKMSVHFAASMAILILSTLAFVVSLATSNWSAAGQQLRMGIWDFCISTAINTSWSCFPINEDFSVAVQAFSILAAMCYACAFVLYLLFLLFIVLQRSRPITLGLCLIVFCIVCLQIMTLVVYGVKNRQIYVKVERDYFSEGLDNLFISWSYAFAIVSSILATVSGMLLYVEFKNLTYDAINSEPPADNV